MTDPVDLSAEVRALAGRLRQGLSGPADRMVTTTDYGTLRAIVSMLDRCADALLADPTPGDRLTEDEREALEMCRASFTPADDFVCGTYVQTVVAALDRLSGSGEQQT